MIRWHIYCYAALDLFNTPPIIINVTPTLHFLMWRTVWRIIMCNNRLPVKRPLLTNKRLSSDAHACCRHLQWRSKKRVEVSPFYEALDAGILRLEVRRVFPFYRRLRESCEVIKMADEIAAEYKTSLEDLTFNSKPVINMLTMVAEENIDYAEQIVGVIEERLNKVHYIYIFLNNVE